MGRIVKGCVREVSLAQVSCILMYVYVAVGAWSMALGLRQRFEYYLIEVHSLHNLHHNILKLATKRIRLAFLLHLEAIKCTAASLPI